MNNPYVSVIMPNYNGSRFIKESIESVLSQTFNNFELIIIDDKSTDDSINIIEEYCSKDNRIRIIKSQQNNGVSITRNIGIDSSQGTYIAFIDNDDLWEKDKLERQIKLLENGADLVYSSYDFYDENSKKIMKDYIVPSIIDYKMMLSENFIGSSSCVAKSNLLKEHKFKSEFYHEDYVLWMELLKIPVKAYGDNKVLMHHRQLENARSYNKKKAAKERWNIYRNALGLNFFESIFFFLKYTIKGLFKYYF